MKDKLKKLTDIKYTDIPNVCFSLTNKNDEREKDFSIQRKKYGFDDSETWCLMSTIASFTIPRLKRYIEITDKMYINEHEKECKQLLKALKLLVRDDSACLFNKKEKKKVKKGLKSFHKVFESLWW